MMEGFRCQQCGNCCRTAGYIELNDSDICRLADNLRISFDMFIKEYTTPKAIDKYIMSGSPCPFYKDGCTVYEARPQCCRVFPFYSPDGKRLVFQVMEKCLASVVYYEENHDKGPEESEDSV